MQNIAQPASSKGNSAQSVIVIAFLLFALAGGIMGFAVGTFAHHTQSQPPAQTNTSPGVKKDKTVTPTALPTATPTAISGVQKLSPPTHTWTQSPTTGAYTVTFTVQSTSNTVLTNSGITCHLAVIKGNSSQTVNVNASALKKISTIDTAQKDEVSTFTFDPSTPKTQDCKQGVGTWIITPTSSTQAGTYYLLGITDWGGLTYNWSWTSIVISKS